MKVKIKLIVSLLTSGTILFSGVIVYAQSSTNYRVDESSFSSGSEFDASSASYGASGTAGLNAVGNASSTNFDFVAGLITPDVPFLEFVVSGATVELGVLDPSTTSSGAAQAGGCSCSFYVRTYLSSAYVVTTISAPPTSEGAVTLSAKAIQAVPSASPGIEEFGINVVANATPAIGADPTNQPDITLADGIAATGYEVADQFKYAQGDVIARAAGTVGVKAWGQTDYTISYIAKNNITTPAGLYTMDHVLVATSTY